MTDTLNTPPSNEQWSNIVTPAAQHLVDVAQGTAPAEVQIPGAAPGTLRPNVAKVLADAQTTLDGHIDTVAQEAAAAGTTIDSHVAAVAQDAAAAIGAINQEVADVEAAAGPLLNIAAATESDRRDAQAAAAAAASSANSSASSAAAAAAAAGVSSTYDTYAQASSDLAAISDTSYVQVLSDEQQFGATTIYRKEAGSLIYKATTSTPGKWLHGLNLISSISRGGVATHIGDSNTVTTGAWRTSYEGILFSKGALLEGWTSYNMGANGQTLAGYVASIDSGDISQAPQDYSGTGSTNLWQHVNAKPHVIFVRLMTNDWRILTGVSVATRKEQQRPLLAKLINFLLSHTQAVIILSMPPTMVFKQDSGYTDFADAQDAADRNTAIRDLHLEWKNVSSRVLVNDSHMNSFALRYDSQAEAVDPETGLATMSDDIHGSYGLQLDAWAISRALRPSDPKKVTDVFAVTNTILRAAWSCSLDVLGGFDRGFYIRQNPQTINGPISYNASRPLSNINIANMMVYADRLNKYNDIVNIGSIAYIYFVSSGNTYKLTGGVTLFTYREVNGDIQIRFGGATPSNLSGESGLAYLYVLEAKYSPIARTINKNRQVNIQICGASPLPIGAKGKSSTIYATDYAIIAHRDTPGPPSVIDVWMSNSVLGVYTDINMANIAKPGVHIATITIDNGIYTSSASDATFNLRVRSVSVTSGGSGYTSATVAFSGGGATEDATGTVTLNNGVVTGITITNRGNGYTSEPNVIISGDGSGAEAIAVIGKTPCNGNDSEVFTAILTSGTFGDAASVAIREI